MNDNVMPQNGWMIVCECDHPFTESKSPIIIPEEVRKNSFLQWNRVLASSHAGYKKDDLVCVRGDTNVQDKLLMDGTVEWGSVHHSQVQHKIDAEHVTHVRNKIRTVDIVVAEIEEASQAAERFRAAQMLSPNSTARRLVN